MNTKLDLKKIEKISKALGDPYRLKIMEAVNKKQSRMECADVVAMFKLAQSTVSHHVKQLVDADLLIAEKEGRNINYEVNKEIFMAYAKYLSIFSE